MNERLAQYPVVIEIPVAWGEMDALAHVNNVVYLRYFESVRITYFERLGLLEYMKENGIGPILAYLTCKFKIPLTYPDTVSVGSRISKIEEDRFTMEYSVVSQKFQKAAAEGEGVIVSFNYREGKKARLPEEWRARIQAIEASAQRGE